MRSVKSSVIRYIMPTNSVCGYLFSGMDRSRGGILTRHTLTPPLPPPPPPLFSYVFVPVISCHFVLFRRGPR
ncbi:hypothetical protein GGS23DRAFT_579347, partial [Durotheca rogersii]|uniref:uncharacterized protein n=1 Tax=Durotheca rogersii TaxID=419775 RepID=UPI002221049C